MFGYHNNDNRGAFFGDDVATEITTKGFYWNGNGGGGFEGTKRYAANLITEPADIGRVVVQPPAVRSLPCIKI